jgi:hypothetical protein
MWISALGYKVSINITYIPKDQGKKYLVLVRENLSGWPEGKALRYANIGSVGDFIWKKIFYRWWIIVTRYGRNG